MKNNKKGEHIVEDEEIVNYLLKNEDIIRKCFKVPEDKSPSTFLISLAYEFNTNSLKLKEYSSASLYATKKTCCSFCAKKLKVKKGQIVSWIIKKTAEIKNIRYFHCLNLKEK